MTNSTRAVLVLLFLAISSAANGSVIHDESTDGDLDGSGLTPTNLGALSLGSNVIWGSTGRDTDGAVDRDYFVVSVPHHRAISAIIVLDGTQTPGTNALSFIALQAGSQVTVATNATSAAGLLGWAHYAQTDINQDILQRMGIPARDSTGFTPPLLEGEYAFWVQELVTGSYAYGFDIQLTTVPEPGAMSLLGTGLVTAAAGLCIRRRRK